MKKLLKILGVFILLIILAIIFLPIIFKSDIQEAIDDAMAENLNANVYYDVDNFGLSLIKNFPDLTVGMEEFGIVGQGQFSEDTLVSINNFEVTVDLMSAFSDQIQIEEILLDQPKIMVLVLEDGTANYDIAKSSDSGPVETPVVVEEQPTETEEETVEETVAEETSDTSGGDGGMSIGINRWAIQDADIVYNDQSSNMYASLLGFTHEGSGDFTLDIFDLTSTTVIEAASFGMGGTEYASNKRIQADITLNMNLPEMTFTFKENRFAVNDFAMGADGYVAMKDGMDMDVSIEGKDIDLKSILSLIPGVYQESLAGITAGGVINFDGYVRGQMKDDIMPKVAANFSVSDGSIRYEDFNIPMEQINIQTSFNYPSADLSETTFNIDKFSMLVDGEQFSSFLKVKDLNNINWDFGFDGNLDLEKITRIVPLDGMELKGKINAGLTSKGKLSDVEAERYESLPTNGNITMDGFSMQSDALPNGLSIPKAIITFNPSEISLSQFDAITGSSDFSLNGSIRNYIGFALKDELLVGTLNLTSNKLDLNEFMESTETPASSGAEESSSEPVEESEPAATEQEPVASSTEQPAGEASEGSAIKIPENVDFTFASSIKQIAVTSITMDNFEGKVLVKDGAVILDNNSFNMLDGTFELDGSYKTKDLDQPEYDFGFRIKEMSIGSAFESFETIRQFVPIAEQVTGKFSTDLSVNGLMGNDMMPIMDKMYLQGLVNVAQATLSGGPFLDKVSAVSSLKSGGSSSEKKLSIKDVAIKTEIKDGKMYVEPFDLEVNGQRATIGGNNTLDGQLDYAMSMKDIPTGALGNAVNSALSSLTGGKKLVSDKVDLNLGIGGTYDDVKVSLLGTSQSGDSDSSSGGSATDVAKAAVGSKVDEQKEKAKEELEKQKEEQRKAIIAKAEEQAAEIREQGKANADKVRKEGYDAADKVIAGAGSNPIKKKVAQTAANKLRSEADKKAADIEAAANQKADELIEKAKERAANL